MKLLKNLLNPAFLIPVALALLVAGCVTQQTDVNGGANTTPTGNVVTETRVIRETVVIPQGQGRLIMGLTSSGLVPEVRSVRMTVDNVEAYSPLDGWVTINGDQATYELINLRERLDVLGDRVIDAGQYTAVRMVISRVMVTDTEQSYVAILPTDELVYNITFNLPASGTSTVVFDVALDRSLHRTQEGQYVMLPVMGITAREGVAISVQQDRLVSIQGPITLERTYGTTVRGETAPDTIVPQTSVIVIENNRIVERTTTTNNTVVNNTVIQNDTPNNTVTDNETNATNDTRRRLFPNRTNVTSRIGDRTGSIFPSRTTNATNNTTNNTTG